MQWTKENRTQNNVQPRWKENNIVILPKKDQLANTIGQKENTLGPQVLVYFSFYQKRRVF